jgi:hypothetical protein
MIRSLRLLSVFLAGALLFTGCEEGGIADLDVPNTNDPTQSSVFENPSDIKALLAGGTTDALQATVSDWGPHMDLMADQTTSTNAFRSFWARATEPRDPINNRTTFATPAIFADPWSNFNQAQGTANQILRQTEDGFTLNGDDKTVKMRASAYFLRGIARGYLGMIYNKAYVIPKGTDALQIDPTQIEAQPYGTVIDSAAADLERAISIIENNGSFTWDLLLGNTYSSAALEEIAHSYAARILMAKARTKEEARNYSTEYLDRIIAHANSGVGSGGVLPSFSPVSTNGDFYNQNADWSSFLISAAGDLGLAGYLPIDIKVQKLLDPSFPTEYPDEGSLGRVSTPDLRQYYFFYTQGFGFLSASRNRNLFSNYFHLRNEGGNNWAARSGDAVVLATGAEMQYLKAEANLLKGNKGAAETALENSPFGTEAVELTNDLPIVQGNAILSSLWNNGPNDDPPGLGIAANGLTGGRDISASASNAEFIRALHTEYSVELFLMGGVGSQWYFMRRHGLLQKGTAEHYPLPGEEIEVTAQDFYTFGGVSNADQPGTAPGGADSWKNFDETYGITSPVGYSSGASEKTLELPNVEELVNGAPQVPAQAGQQ